MPATVVRADAARLPLTDSSVDLIVTSPPYWSLRSYTDGGEHYAGQIGAEPTPAEYIDSLIRCTREWVRVLKPSGSMWVNLGDKYATRWASRSEGGGLHNDRGRDSRAGRNNTGAPEKSLIGLPWRYAIRCIDDLGLILRAEVIWSKPNGLPESVTDRVRRSHETWFHFTKSPRYFSAVDNIREPHSDTSAHAASRRDRTDARLTAASAGMVSVGNPLGKLPGSVWEIATQPLKVPAKLGVDHFAAFPMEWPRRIISGWSPSGICTACGEGRRPVVDRGESSWQRRRADGDPSRYGLMGTAAPLQRSVSDPADRAAGGFGVPATRVVLGGVCACTPYADGAAMCPACNCPLPLDHDSTSTAAVRGMPAAHHRNDPATVGVGDQGAAPESVLLEGVREPAHGSEPGSESRVGADDEGLHCQADAGPPDGGPIGVCPATSAGDGRAAGSDAAPGRGGASPEREPGGQQAGEPDGDGEAGSRQRVRVDQALSDRVPVLRSRGAIDAGCPRCGSPPTRPSVVLDPFGGTGTTALVADALGRHGISVDMSADYCRLATWRTQDQTQRDRAAKRKQPARRRPRQASNPDNTLF